MKALKLYLYLHGIWSSQWQWCNSSPCAHNHTMMETQVHFTQLELKYIQFNFNYVKYTLQFSEEEMYLTVSI